MKTFPPFPKLGERGHRDNYFPCQILVTALCQRHMATWLNVNIVLIGFTKTV